MASVASFESISVEMCRKIKDFAVEYSFGESRFGKCILGLNKGRVCYLSFLNDKGEEFAVERMQGEWPKAVLKRGDDKRCKEVVDKIFEDTSGELGVLISGTDFQMDVWKELVKIKRGATVSYEDVARSIGKPKAVRAVASAVGKNKIAYLIPCHRVIYKDGSSGKYGGGIERKREMLVFEGAKFV